MTPELTAVLAIVLGCALRTLLPYVLTGLQKIAESGEWASWPRFEPAYLSAFVLAVMAYALTLITIPGAWGALLAMAFVQVVALAYAGQDLARHVLKAGAAIAAGRR